jgi:transposase
LVPSEGSTGEQVRRGIITKAGNLRARRVLIEGAWTYRYPARLSRPLQVRQESLPEVETQHPNHRHSVVSKTFALWFELSGIRHWLKR